MREIDNLIEAKREAFNLAADHVKAQHVVWDNTEIPPCALLDLIEKNLRMMALWSLDK